MRHKIKVHLVANASFPACSLILLMSQFPKGIINLE